MKCVIGYIIQYDEQFHQIMSIGHEEELAVKRRTIDKAEWRIEEQDRLFKSTYEDKANGVLSESFFKMLADNYEREQAELREIVAKLTAENEQQKEQADNLDRFIEKVHKYFDLQELTPTLLNDMVKRVEVYALQTVDGHRTQQIDIYYDLVGFLPLSLFQEEMQYGIA